MILKQKEKEEKVEKYEMRNSKNIYEKSQIN